MTRDSQILPDVREFLFRLAQTRPLFHSEADLQHAFAWALHERAPDAQVRLERPFRTEAGVLHVDLEFELAQQTLLIELKYKTRGLRLTIGQEAFVLVSHGSQPPGRYDVIKDLARLEALTSSRSDFEGYLIFLTNDSAYWDRPRSDSDTSASFSLHEGRTLSGVLSWAPSTGPGTMRGRENPLRLKGAYTLQWNDYSRPGSSPYSRFRYLAVNVAA